MPRKLAELSGLYQVCLGDALAVASAARPGSDVFDAISRSGKEAFEARVAGFVLERSDRAMSTDAHETMALLDRGAMGLMALTVSIVSGAIRDAMSIDVELAA